MREYERESCSKSKPHNAQQIRRDRKSRKKILFYECLCLSLWTSLKKLMMKSATSYGDAVTTTAQEEKKQNTDRV